ncbi:hypothetical protein GOBAR_AA38836 [Gossypium barbadense]|uniref:RING-type domain-containing protein n=1 Tax=Gossypium barbadense TaxID=3634 RepID=A0A2P5VSV1_GOSBA|nr:hypothetical protein GOBAR_AA38836 [Gossypium barbadense]
MEFSNRGATQCVKISVVHANVKDYECTMAFDYPREKDGARLQMRLSYSPAAQFFLFLVQWTDCQLAGALGLLRILIYMTYADGKTTMSVYERKASIREFYAVIFPSLLQLQKGITSLEDRKQKEVCTMRYRKKDESERGKLSEIDLEREEECGICLEMSSMVVLPNCSHSLCLKCYRDWHGRSQSCPFCRDSLKRVNSCDLWIYTEKSEIVDLSLILRENSNRLFMYIDKLPLIVPDPVFVPYDVHVRPRLATNSSSPRFNYRAARCYLHASCASQWPTCDQCIFYERTPGTNQMNHSTPCKNNSARKQTADCWNWHRANG